MAPILGVFRASTPYIAYCCKNSTLEKIRCFWKVIGTYPSMSIIFTATKH